MITWLFTQVWLWSLAAFALGALITWLLFVRPLQRRLAEVAEYPDYDYDRTADYDEPDTAREPLELLRPTPPRDPDEPPIGDWDRPPRAWADPRLQPEEDTENTWFRKWDEEAPEGGLDPAATAVQPRVLDGPADPKGDADTRVESAGPTGDADTWRASAGPEDDADTWRASADPTDGADTWAGPGRVEPEDRADTRTEPSGANAKDSAEPDTAVTPVGREEPQPAASFSGQLEDAERLSGQLRSLFESEQKSGAQPATPYVPPVGAEATQVMPAVADDEDVPPLPQRTPGAGPHPGRDSGWSGPMVKGHSASRQYHTPESPQYDDIVADVWFRSSKDAEIAGFTSWNGG
ncbi:hypothetical protein SAMN05421805_108262 [Saccharopolyspora antimicrobica]|uniref:Uncharacterized protein n=1 Tax=Saccharopolyspora antimicrobica TaxID=455193 RepID=A0A1I5DTF0_9PSEU|nr:hypothetical protein [Saccharopolyspora antimicrobica]RKT84996.1 hypothetical protein ATL45_3328 [Saccharopolyspora antimicrobica]SFO02380.1 hypothetical protein SAMN05421805_108262 [Saccharopolyspora antimicrobica]